MFMTYFSIRFHFPVSNSSLVIIIKVKAEKNFAWALFYILPNTTIIKAEHFSKIYYSTSCHDTILSNTTVASSPPVILLLIGG